MKKVCFILMSVFLFSVSVKAQIQRNFDGIVLGKATKNEIVNYLRQKNIYPEEKYGGRTIFADGDVSFGGVIWNGTIYNLYNGVLFQIRYFKASRRNKQEIDEIYYRLRNRLLKKYTKQKLPPSNAVIPDRLFLNGKNTTAEISRMDEKRFRIVRLMYTDVELAKKAKKKDNDEL